MLQVSFLWHLLNVNPLLCGGSRRRLKASKLYSHVNSNQDNRNGLLRIFLTIRKTPLRLWQSEWSCIIGGIIIFK